MPPRPNTIFGTLLRTYRLRAGLTQEALAERAELSPRGLIHLEHGTRRPYPSTVQRLTTALALNAEHQAAFVAAAFPGVSPAGASPPATPAPASLFGRDRELATLVKLLDRAAGGGGLVLISGEAGIGKTALATAALEVATHLGFTVIEGHCYDRSETPAYGPWWPLIEQCARAGVIADATIQHIHSNVAETPVRQDVLFRSVLAGVRAIAATQPLVLLLDDVQWADAASLDLLRVAARSIRSAPVVLLVTYRSDEVQRGHPLAVLLPLLVREAGAERIELGPLDRDALSALIAARFALEASEHDRLVAYVAERSQGNALFVGELLRTLDESGAIRQVDERWQLGELAPLAVPELLRQVIDERVARLGRGVQRLLTVAAIIGHEVPLDIWATVADVSDDDLLDVVEAAVEARLLVERPGGDRVQFTHALIRDTLYDGILAARRRRMHRGVGEALVMQSTPDPDAVAFHFEQAGDGRAVPWLVVAGDRADRLDAYVTAADRHTRALALLGDEDPRLRGWLLVRLGILLRHRDLARALGYLETAELAVHSADDSALTTYWQASRGMLRCLAGSGRTGLPDLDAGVRGIRALPDNVWSTGSLPACVRVALETDGESTYADWLAILGNLEEGRDYCEALLARWAGEGRARPAGDVNFGLALAHTGLGHPDAAIEAIVRARDAYRQIGNHGMAIMITRLQVRFILLPYYADRGTEQRAALRAAHDEMARDLARLVDGGAVPPEVADLMARLLDSDSSVVAGHWAETRQAAMTVLEQGISSLFLRQVGASHAAIARGQGDLDVAWRLVRLALPAGADYQSGDQPLHIALPLQQLAPALALDTHDLPTARAWLDAYDRWLTWTGAVLGRSEGQALWAEYHRQAGEPQRAQAHAEAALAHAADPRQPLALLAAHRLLGELGIEAGQYDEAEAHLANALLLADACAASFERALTLLVIAKLQASQDAADRARASLSEARAICEPLGARPTLQRIAALQAELAT